MSDRLWDKGEAADAGMMAFCVGEDHLLDARLVVHDVRASIAHATMLGECGHLEGAEVEALCGALREID